MTSRKSWLFTWQCTRRRIGVCVSKNVAYLRNMVITVREDFHLESPLERDYPHWGSLWFFLSLVRNFPGTKLPFSQNFFHNKQTLPLRRDSYGQVSIWAAFIAAGSTFCPRRWSHLYTLTTHFSNCHYNSPPICALDLTCGLRLFTGNFWHTQHVAPSQPLGHYIVSVVQYRCWLNF